MHVEHSSGVPPRESLALGEQLAITTGADPTSIDVAHTELIRTPSIPKSTPVQEAIADVQNRDTFDAYSRRLNGTSALVTRATTMVGLPTLGAALMSGPFELTTRFAAGSTATVLTGAVVSTAAYVTQRATEKNRAIKREKVQQTIRDHLEEPVDLIRQKSRRKQNRSTTLRWYGADEQFGGHDDPTTPNRFAKIVDFAEEQKLDHVVVSKALLNKNEELAKKYEDNAITTELLTTLAKGVRISDKLSDEALLKLTTKEARELVSKLESQGKILRVEALAEWLLACDPAHSAAQAYTDWAKHGKSKELKPALINAMRTCVERRAQDETFGESRRMTIETDEKRVAIKERLTTTVTALPDGVRTLSQGIEAESAPSITMGYRGFSETIGMNIETFVAAMTKVSTLNLQALRKSTDKQANQMAIELGKQSQKDIELALYYALNKPDIFIKGLRSGSAKIGGTAANSQTLYSRMVEERPRTLMRLPSRGKVTKEEQTVTYKRLIMRNLGKKVGAAALAAVIGMGAGWGWSEAWSTAENWTDYCDPNYKPVTSKPKDEKLCAEGQAFWHPIAEVPADAVHHANTSLENKALTQAYKWGILDRESMQKFGKYITDGWAQQKRDDILDRFNLYGGSESHIGDVKHNGNPAVWSLESIHGANTVGFWAENIQDHITIGDSSFITDKALPPLSDGGVNLTSLQVRDTLLPFGAEVPASKQNDVVFIRELNIPERPTSNAPVVRVSGRVLLGDNVKYGIAADGGYQKELIAFSLPVIEGGDITAAKLTLRDLATDEIIGNPETFVYQQEDGTFRIGVPRLEQKDGYMDVEYWVDPEAKTDLPVRALHPMTSQKRGEYYQPLTTVLTEHDTKKLRDRLGVQLDAPAAQIAHSIANSRTYSFNPYEDSKKENPKTINPVDSRYSTAHMLTATAEYAEELDAANCNVSTDIQIVTSRGKDGVDGFINGVSGFNNPAGKGSDVLSQTESHQKTVTDKAVFVDPTPAGQPVEPEAETYKPSSNPALQSGDTTSPTLIAEGAAVFGLSAYAGAKFFPMEIAYRRRRRLEQAAAWVAQTEEVDNSGLHSDLNIINHILHSVEPLHEDSLPLHISHGSNYTAEDRLRMLPNLTARGFKLYTTTLAENGVLRLSSDTQLRLNRIIAAAHILKSTQTSDRQN